MTYKYRRHGHRLTPSERVRYQGLLAEIQQLRNSRDALAVELKTAHARADRAEAAAKRARADSAKAATSRAKSRPAPTDERRPFWHDLDEDAMTRRLGTPAGAARLEAAAAEAWLWPTTARK